MPKQQQRGGFLGWASRVAPELFAVDIGPGGLPARVPNPPVTTPVSQLTRPISVVSAIDFYQNQTVSREVLMAIPAFRRAALLIAGVTGSLPYSAYRDGVRMANQFLEQPESGEGVTRSVTWTRVAMDLFFEGQSLLRVIDFYADGFPRAAKHIEYKDWSQDERTGVVTADGEKLGAREVRLFTSPFPGLCSAAGPTVAMLNRLRALSAWYASHPQAREHFSSDDGSEPDEEEIAAFLAKWQAAREAGATAFVPPGLVLNNVDQMTPEQLTMMAAKEWEIAEVSRLTGVDPGFLAINITSRTYSNIIDERRNLIDLQCGPFVQSIEQRLSLGDTTPTGQQVRANLDVFLRSNTTERYAAYATALAAGFLTIDEVRALENRPPLPTEALRTPPVGPDIAQGGGNA